MIFPSVRATIGTTNNDHNRLVEFSHNPGSQLTYASGGHSFHTEENIQFVGMYGSRARVLLGEEILLYQG